MRKKTLRMSRNKSKNRRRNTLKRKGMTRRKYSFKKKRTMKKNGGYLHFGHLICNKDNVMDWFSSMKAADSRFPYIKGIIGPKYTTYKIQIPGYNMITIRYDDIKNMIKKANLKLVDNYYTFEDKTSQLRSNLENCKTRLLELEKFTEYLNTKSNNSFVRDEYKQFFVPPLPKEELLENLENWMWTIEYGRLDDINKIKAIKNKIKTLSDVLPVFNVNITEIGLLNVVNKFKELVMDAIQINCENLGERFERNESGDELLRPGKCDELDNIFNELKR